MLHASRAFLFAAALSCLLAAYALGRLRFRLRKLWFTVMIGTLLLPGHVLIVPQYILFRSLGLVGGDKKNKWKSKVDALVLLAEDQRGKPEGDLAREKLLEIIRHHPEAKEYEPLVTLVQRDITMRDLAELRRAGGSTDGRWTGNDFFSALELMKEDYRQRLILVRRLRLPAGPSETKGTSQTP